MPDITNHQENAKKEKKPTMRYHLTPVIMATIKKQTNKQTNKE